MATLNCSYAFARSLIKPSWLIKDDVMLSPISLPSIPLSFVYLKYILNILKNIFSFWLFFFNLLSFYLFYHDFIYLTFYSLWPRVLKREKSEPSEADLNSAWFYRRVNFISWRYHGISLDLPNPVRVGLVE